MTGSSVTAPPQPGRPATPRRRLVRAGRIRPRPRPQEPPSPPVVLKTVADTLRRVGLGLLINRCSVKPVSRGRSCPNQGLPGGGPDRGPSAARGHAAGEAPAPPSLPPAGRGHSGVCPGRSAAGARPEAEAATRHGAAVGPVAAAARPPAAAGRPRRRCVPLPGPAALPPRHGHRRLRGARVPAAFGPARRLWEAGEGGPGEARRCRPAGKAGAGAARAVSRLLEQRAPLPYFNCLR